MSSLNIASRALTTNLAAMQVIGHNIANVNTDGYSRQNILLGTSGGQFLGNGYFGKGVEIEGVSRAYDSYLTREAQLTRSVSAGDEARYARLQQLESLFPLGDQSLGVTLNNALNAWSAVATSPLDTTARTVVIARSEELTARLRDVTASLDETRLSSTLQVQEAVKSINSLAEQIAQVNQTIVQSQGTGRSPNDLLDQRDQLVSQLNQYVQTSTVPAADGSLTVFVGGSQPLVLGTRVSPMAAERNPVDGDKLDIKIYQAGQPAEINADFLGGGALKGLVRFVNEDLPESYNMLGRLALSMSEQVNAQHRLGLDANGDPGENFYQIRGAGTADSIYSYGADGSLQIAAKPIGTASGSGVVATVSDFNALQASDYEIRVGSGTDVTVIRKSTNESVQLTSAPDPISGNSIVSIDGLRIDLGASPANGDRFLLQPYAGVARNLEVALSSPQDVAAASSVRVDVPATNAGSLLVENLAAVATPPVGWTGTTISFNTLGQYTTDGGGSWNTFQPGQPISVDGFQLVLRGVPTNGDTFNISPATAADAAQNFGNAKAILGLRDKASFGGVNLGDGYIPVFSALANKVQAGRVAAEFSTTAATNAATALANRTGVNLDEEAARLLQFQQAYQASAKFLQVAQGTFDTLIQSFG
ncbi:MAG TPA: flagellar hook-associated protein FlgK [Burkholderiaceae bacterium]|jgi:flagellar hook-associated protein 1 FlgK|nr:flagellar hook-associated protein FlgK [Burkholderiaceae bacterium]